MLTARHAAVGTPAASMISLANALEPSSRGDLARGPEGGDAACGQRVDQTGDERRLGPDDDEVDRLALGRRGQGVDVVDADVEQVGVGGDAGVAGRAEHLRRLRRAPQRADDRVLAPARADDEDLHAATDSR